MSNATKQQPLRSVDQDRARFAWECVNHWLEERNDKNVPKKGGKEYAGEAKKLPIRIMSSGLGQALAFLHSRAARSDKFREPLTKLHHDLSEQVLSRCLADRKEGETLLTATINRDLEFMRRATDEVLVFLRWLNSFAEGEGLSDES